MVVTGMGGALGLVVTGMGGARGLVVTKCSHSDREPETCYCLTFFPQVSAASIGMFY